MQLRLTNLRLPVDAAETELPKRLSQTLSVPVGEILSWRILRKSLDARSKQDFKFVYTVVVQVPDDPQLAKKFVSKPHVETFLPETFDDPPAGDFPLEHRPVVVRPSESVTLAGRGFRLFRFLQT